jgi:hypothetical protein
MSYEAWRREVALGTMADWNEDRGGYDPPPRVGREASCRLWDRQLKCWVRLHGYAPYDTGTPTSRYSRVEEP